jgi:hypothetical protein
MRQIFNNIAGDSMLRLWIFSIFLLVSLATPAQTADLCASEYKKAAQRASGGEPLPDYWSMDENRRWTEIEKLLGHALTPEQKLDSGLKAVHLIGLGKKGLRKGTLAERNNFTFLQLLEKSHELKKLGFNRRDREILMRKGVVGFGDFLETFSDNLATAQKVEAVLNGDPDEFLAASRNQDLAHGDIHGALDQEAKRELVDGLLGNSESSGSATHGSTHFSTDDASFPSASGEAANITEKAKVAAQSAGPFVPSEDDLKLFQQLQSGKGAVRIADVPEGAFESVVKSELLEMKNNGNRYVFTFRSEGKMVRAIGKVVKVDDDAHIQLDDGNIVRIGWRVEPLKAVKEKAVAADVASDGSLVSTRDLAIQETEQQSKEKFRVAAMAERAPAAKSTVESWRDGRIPELPESILDTDLRYSDFQRYTQDGKPRVFWIWGEDHSSRYIVGKVVAIDSDSTDGAKLIGSSTEAWRHKPPKGLKIETSTGESLSLPGENVRGVVDNPLEATFVPPSVKESLRLHAGMTPEELEKLPETAFELVVKADMVKMKESGKQYVFSFQTTLGYPKRIVGRVKGFSPDRGAEVELADGKVTYLDWTYTTLKALLDSPLEP